MPDGSSSGSSGGSSASNMSPSGEYDFNNVTAEDIDDMSWEDYEAYGTWFKSQFGYEEQAYLDCYME